MSLFDLLCNEDVGSVILLYLNGLDLLHCKLSNSYFQQLIQKVVPLHNFMFILHSIYCNSQQDIPSLNIPTNFTLDNYLVRKISNFYSKPNTSTLHQIYSKISFPSIL